VKVALTIAGSDPSGGAGIQADLRAFAAAGVRGASVVTLLTAQGTRGVRSVHVLRPAVVEAQMRAVLADLPVRAAKTGALGSAAIVRLVSRRLPRLPLVVDPVLRSTSGATLLDRAGLRALRDELLPRATVVTPNADEAALLSGLAVKDADGARAAGLRIRSFGVRAVLVTGGHLPGARARDLLVDDEGETWLSAPRRTGVRLHGAGCALSAALTAHLAQGEDLRSAARAARRWVARAIRKARRVGPGLVPVG
jgi:hydroxymethylpyrimidine/phosphomethylpyrimidine kinase